MHKKTAILSPRVVLYKNQHQADPIKDLIVPRSNDPRHPKGTFAAFQYARRRGRGYLHGRM